MRFVSPISFLYPERLAVGNNVAPAWIPHVPFAFWLVEALRPSSIVELGTHTGVSYFAFCQAVQHLQLDTRCHAVDTWLGDEHTGYYGEGIYEDVNAYNDARYARFSALLRMTFDEAASYFVDGSVDLLHVDGCHTYDAVRRDFETWAPKLSQHAVVLFHDTNVRERGFGVYRLWDELRQQYPHFEFVHGSGLGVLAVGPKRSAEVDAFLATSQDPTLTTAIRQTYERLGTGLDDRHALYRMRRELLAHEADRARASMVARDVEIEHLRNEAARLRDSVEDLQRDLAGRAAEADRVAAELAEIRRSTTWRATAPARSFLARRPRLTRGLRRTAKVVWWTVTLQLIERLRERRERERAQPHAQGYAEWVRAYDTISDHDLDALRKAQALLTRRPLISVVMPVFDTDEYALREAVESVLGQVYEDWELCIADDASTKPAVRRLLEEFQGRDARVRVVAREAKGGISAASNAALEIARGEWVALLDHDDVLRPHALFMVARTINDYPDATFIYSDEDKIDTAGTRSDPYFKPDWNQALFYSQNYVCHLATFRRDLAVACGGFRSEFDGAQDWDLFLRMTGAVAPETIHHVPHVLYHWRVSGSSTALDANVKPYGIAAATQALNDRLAADQVQADVQPILGQYKQVRYRLPVEPPSVTIVVPTTGEPQLLRPCIEGLLHRTDYPLFSVFLTMSEKAMDAPGRRAYLERVAKDPRVRLLLYDDRPFNFSWVNNWAVSKADGDIICFLNDDTEPIGRDWLAAMVGHVLQRGVGAVGAKLYYPDETIQHAGVALGLAGVAGHLHRSLARDSAGYFGRAKLDQDVSCVTAGCMLVRKAVFDELGGFDEAFAVAFNDVDLCIRIRKAGWRIVWTPSAELYHRESSSVGRHDSPERRMQFDHEMCMIRKRWSDTLAHDPHYNPNLSLEREWQPAFPPRVVYPWRALPAAEADRQS